MTIGQYRELNNTDGLIILNHKGELLDEVLIYGILKLKIYRVANFYVQAIFNKNDNRLLEIKPLQNENDWDPYLETVDLKEYF